MISHTQAEVTVYRPDPDEMCIERLSGHTILHISRASRISVDDELFGSDLAREAAALRRLADLAWELAGELDRRVAVDYPSPPQFQPGEAEKSPAGEPDTPEHTPALASSTRPDTQPSPGLSGHSPAGPDSDTQPDPYIDAMAAGHEQEYEPEEPEVVYLACGDQLAAQAEPGAKVECPRHGTVAVVSREAYTDAATGHPNDPGDSGAEFLPAPAEPQATS